MKKIIFWNIIALIFFSLDRFIKIKCRASRGILFFKNYNLAFGFPFPIPKNILIILMAAIIFILFFYLIKNYKKKDTALIIPLTFIIFGAISNLIDRLVYGYVIDYIDISFFTIFNLADIMIGGGVIMLVYKYAILKDRNLI